jgi:hypothetical protein
MASPHEDAKTSTPAPTWSLHHMASSHLVATEELIWSVGGSLDHYLAESTEIARPLGREADDHRTSNSPLAAKLGQLRLRFPGRPSAQCAESHRPSRGSGLHQEAATRI